MSENVLGELDAMNKSLDNPDISDSSEEPKADEAGEDQEAEKAEEDSEKGTPEEAEKAEEPDEEVSEESDDEESEEDEEPEEEDKSSDDEEEEEDSDAEKDEKAEPDEEPEKGSDEMTGLRAEIIGLKSELAKLKVGKVPKVDEEPKAKPEDEDKEEDFVKDLDLDELARDPKELNKALNSIYKKAKKDAGTAIMKQVPGLISEQVNTIAQMQAVAEDFWSSNEDLRGFPKVVQTVYDEVVAESSDKTLGDALEATAVGFGSVSGSQSLSLKRRGREKRLSSRSLKVPNSPGRALGLVKL